MNKSNSHAFINQILVYSLVLICLTGSIGVGTVWLRQQIAQTANSIKRLESGTAELERRYAETTSLIAAEQAPAALKARNVSWNLGLQPPNQMAQVVNLKEVPEQRLAAKRNSEIFLNAETVKPVRFVLDGSH